MRISLNVLKFPPLLKGTWKNMMELKLSDEIVRHSFCSFKTSQQFRFYFTDYHPCQPHLPVKLETNLKKEFQGILIIKINTSELFISNKPRFTVENHGKFYTVFHILHRFTISLRTFIKKDILINKIFLFRIYFSCFQCTKV